MKADVLLLMRENNRDLYMQKLLKRFGIALLSFTALSISINVQDAKADDIYDKCYKFNQLLNEQELEYCRSAAPDLFNNRDAQILPRKGIHGTSRNSITNIKPITNIGCDIFCWDKLRLEEKQRKEGHYVR
jgi:hypothetical protein